MSSGPFSGPSIVKLENEKIRSFRVPYFLNPYGPTTAGITASYFEVGIAMLLMSTPMAYYLVDNLDVSATGYSAYSTLIALPWSLKFLFGMVTDGNPIFGYRRKSWLTIGWGIYILIAFVMYFFSTPSFTAVTLSMFAMTCAYLQADVAADASAVERARFETEKRKGILQTACYTVRSFGSLIGAILGAILYNTSSWGWGLTISQLYLLSAILPLVGVVLFIWPLEEIEVTKVVPTVREQLWSIWDTLQLWAVIRPVSFVFIYGCLQVPNQAWTNFLVVGLDFSDFEIGMITVAGYVLYYLGMMIYRNYFFETSWRMIYVYTTILGTIFSMLQVILVLGYNTSMGIPDFYFALGDTAVTTMISGVQFMPTCIMYVMLCPEGCEGITYALLTTIGNLAGTVASDIGTGLTLIWDVDNDTLEDGDYSGVLYLTILTSFLQLSGLCFLMILPDNKTEVKSLIESGIRSVVGGQILAATLVTSLVVTIALNIYWIWN